MRDLFRHQQNPALDIIANIHEFIAIPECLQPRGNKRHNRIKKTLYANERI
jgi:hypothetical protein